MSSKIPNFIFFIILIILVFSLVTFAAKIFVYREKEIIMSDRTIEAPKIKNESFLDIPKDVPKIQEQKIRETIPADNTSSQNNNSSKPKGSGSGSPQYKAVKEEDILLGLWYDTLKESGISEEFLKEHVTIQGYKKSSFEDGTYFRIYLTYSIDWVNLSIIYPVLVEKKYPLPSVTGNAVFNALGKEEIKKEMKKNIHIFRERKIIPRERYLNIIKEKCFNELDINSSDRIKPEFGLSDNYVTASYFDYISYNDNKCAISTVNLEDGEDSCKPIPCISINIIS